MYFHTEKSLFTTSYRKWITHLSLPEIPCIASFDSRSRKNGKQGKPWAAPQELPVWNSLW
jgi:hypothetical protein